jgi:hypothetical protein
MKIVKTPQRNYFTTISLGGNTQLSSAGELYRIHKNIPIPTQQNQKALKNFLRSSNPSV